MPRDSVPDGKNTLRFKVGGHSCASCVGRAKNAMAAVAGVASAGVNLATGQATVEFMGPAAPELIREATAKAGYPAQMTDISLDVQGATCASCVLRIETALNAVPGVASSTMNLANSRARATVYTGMVERMDLVRAIQAIGYSVDLDTAPAGAKPADRHAEAAAAVKTSVILAAILSTPVFVAEMGAQLFPAIHHYIAGTIGVQTSRVLQFILTTLVLIGPGRGFFTKGFPALWRRAPDMNSLVALGTSAAWIYSTIATFAPTLLPEGTGKVYFESAALIVTLILLGRYMEARAKGRTGDAIKGLLALAPDFASVERDGIVTTMPIEQIRTGDILHLKPGERLAVDGSVASGASFIEESMITGEPLPVEKTTGDPVTCGTINGTGALTYSATAVGRDTLLARIVSMVGTGRAAGLGVLFRRGEALKTLQQARVVALNKTGTLTAGHPELTDLVLADGQSEAKTLPILVAVENQSEHPIARAITRAAVEKSMKLPKVTPLESLTGNGVRATVGKKTVLIGADRFMAMSSVFVLANALRLRFIKPAMEAV